MTVLEAVRVSKHYGTHAALTDVSLTITRGECLALVGASGSGKTTLLRCFNRMVVPDEGVIRVEGDDLTSVDPVGLRRRIGYVPQEGGLLPHWRVLRNVGLVPWLTGHPDPDRLAREALGTVGLDPDRFATRWPSGLSGGERQRVALARALAASPALVLLDEPFGALDAITRAELQETFSGVRQRIGVTCLLVTHDLHEASALADRIAVLAEGRLEQVDTPAGLVGAPGTPYVRHLLQRARLLAP